jgi:mycothiol S-conjugate amidase
VTPERPIELERRVSDGAGGVRYERVAVEAAEGVARVVELVRPRRGSGDPWQPLKLYYDVGFSRPRMLAMHEALLEMGVESPFKEWLARWEDRPDRQITTRITCGDWFDRRDKALLAHATQIDPDGWFFSIPRDVQARVWPTEDYELARSLVSSEIPEDDLFAGIRDRAVV